MGTWIAIIVYGIVVDLEFIHLLGMIHRGMKLESFQIDKEGWCYVDDFGSSKLLAMTQLLSLDSSTLGHVAPELYDDEGTQRRSTSSRLFWLCIKFSLVVLLMNVSVNR